MKYLCEKIVEKILDMAITAAVGAIISYVTAWCWNQASVQEMRRKFEELLVRAKMVNPTAQNTANLQVQQLLREVQNEAEQESQPGLVLKILGSGAREKIEGSRMVNPIAQQSNTANLQFQQLLREVQNEAEQESQPGLVLKISGSGAREKFEGLRMVNPTAQQSNTANLQFQQLLREVQNEAEQGKELLDSQPTPVNLSNAKERFERIIVVLKLNNLLLSNAREAGVHPKIKRPQFKPRYLRSSEAGVHPKIKRPQFKPRYLRSSEAGVHPKIKRPQFKPHYLNRRTRFQVICSYNCY